MPSILIAFLSFLSKEIHILEYKAIISVESIIPNQCGKYRLISAEEVQDYTPKHDEGRNKSYRRDIKIDKFEETNFWISII